MQAYEWEKKHRGPSFDYFILRTEDLLDPATKFKTIRALATFVGSDITDDAVCCMAVAPATFMGSHTKGNYVCLHATRCISRLNMCMGTGVTAKTAGSGSETVHSRYGEQAPI